MQRILQRGQAARRRAQQQAALRKARFDIKESKQASKEQAQFMQARATARKEERKNRRDDWEMGAIAPRRDVGSEPGHFGTVAQELFRHGRISEREQATAKWKYPFRAGDRAVVMKGPHKGNIGTISGLQPERLEVVIDPFNLVEVPYGKAEQEMLKNNRQHGEQLAPFHYDDIRLVASVEDPETGIPREVIVEQVEYLSLDQYEREGEALQRGRDWTKFKPKFDKDEENIRFIAGTMIPLPWPETSEPERSDNAVDTLRIEVEDRSYMPRLLSPPMPNGIIDELRNKYSRYRVRHDPEYLALREAEERRKEASLNPRLNSMRTPLEELRHQRKVKTIEQPVELSTEMLEEMGKLLQARRQNAPTA